MTSQRLVSSVLAAAVAIAAAGVALLVERGGPASAPVPAPSSASPAAVETLEEQLERVAHLVEGIRGHTFEQLPSATYLSPDELAARATAFVDEYAADRAAVDARILRTLGAIPADYDLVAGLRALLSEQVAGFYDPETGEMVVGVEQEGRRLSPLEELFLAHELEHALADAAIGLPDDPDTPLAEDAALAISALVEGDASLTMQRYVTVGLSALDQLRLAGETVSTLQQVEALEAQPWVVRRSLEFPYLEGLAFVTRLRRQGGWEAVDRAYASPPTTSAQILFPERFAAGTQALPVPDPGQPPDPWSQRARTSFGAADLLFLFEAPGDDRGAALEDARRRAGSWGGGALTLWTDGDRNALAIVVVERSTTGELCDAMAAWYLRAFPDVGPIDRRDGEVLAADGPQQDAVVHCGDGIVRVGIGPDVATARAAAG